MNIQGTLLEIPPVLLDPSCEGDFISLKWVEEGQPDTIRTGVLRIDRFFQSFDDSIIYGYIRYSDLTTHKTMVVIDKNGGGKIDIEEMWF